MILKLDDTSLNFPDPELADEDGLLAMGGDLSTERLKVAYNNGIFPWFSGEEPIFWYSPHLRCVIFPDKINISQSMEKIISKKIFEIKIDTAFEKVIENCKNISRPGQEGTWISNTMQNSYTKFHHEGMAHSIEAWQGDKLVGGLYGVAINGVFCGESMFSKVSNASKSALIWLCQLVNIN